MADPSVIQTIISVGQQRGLSEREIVAALSTGLVESGLRNVDHGDRDSLGVFQQRPSQGWGSPEQVSDVTYATNAFYDRIEQFDAPGKSGADLAADIQRPAAQYRGRYAERWDEALALYREHGGAAGASQEGGDGFTLFGEQEQFDPEQSMRSILQVMSDKVRDGSLAFRIPTLDEDLNSVAASDTPERAAGAGDEPWRPSTEDPVDEDAMQRLMSRFDFSREEALAEPGDLGHPSVDGNLTPGPQSSREAQQLIDIASGFIGTPYLWGGTTPNGFDCSGLIQYAAKQMGVSLPRVSRDQAKVGQDVGKDMANARAGDLIAFASRGLEVGHIGIYLGDGKMLHAPRAGKNVEIVNVADYWGDRIATIRRIFGGADGPEIASVAPATTAPSADRPNRPATTAPRTRSGAGNRPL